MDDAWKTYVFMERKEGGGALRTPTLEGYIQVWPPQLGQIVGVVAKPLATNMTARLVTTSRVKEMKKFEGRWGEDIYEVRTETGSLYRLTWRPAPPEEE